MPKFFARLIVMIAVLLPTGANAVEFVFASAEEGREILLSQDSYFNRMSAPEIAIRMSSETADKTAADLKALYAESVLDWTEEEIEQFRSVIEENWDGVERVSHLLPDTVYFIRATTGIEGGLPHTHANAIIIQNSVEELSAFLFFHELFHVLSRHNSDKQAEIYGLLGFQACTFEEPGQLAAIHLTNPDVPFDAYYLTVQVLGTPRAVIPFLYAAHPAFNPEVENGFPGHFGFGLLLVEVLDGSCSAMTDEDGNAIIQAVDTVPGYLEALGGNTGYIIHPEETISDNFVFLVTGKEDLQTPELPAKIGAWIDAQK